MQWRREMMKKSILFLFLPLFLTISLLLIDSLAGESHRRECPPDKDLCALMIRRGVEAFDRGKYQDARAYFRKAIAADPESEVAWKYYDLSMLYDLGKQIATTGKYTSHVPSVTISIPEERPKSEKELPSIKLPPQAKPSVKKGIAVPSTQQPKPKEIPKPPPPGEKEPIAQEEPKGAIIVDDEGC